MFSVMVTFTHRVGNKRLNSETLSLEGKKSKEKKAEFSLMYNC